MRTSVLLVTLFSMTTWAKPYRIQNVLEIPYALESTTGVDRFEPVPAAVFQQAQFVFPKFGVLEEISPSFVLAQVNYSGAFCEILIQRDLKLPRQQRWTHKSIDLKIPIQRWTSQERELLLTEYGELFWRRKLNGEEMQILTEALGELISQQKTESSNTTMAVLTGLCATFASSTAFLSID